MSDIVAQSGHAVVRRRGDGALELRVNGVFVMDDAQTSSERALGQAAVVPPGGHVLVGGLGLGYTVGALLDRDDIGKVTVVEIEPAIVRWMRDELIPGADLLADPRLDVVVDDVVSAVARRHDGECDAIVLDVDNGPDFLVFDENRRVYDHGFVADCVRCLRPGGRLHFWSQADSESLRRVLNEHTVSVDVRRVPVALQGRRTDYWLLSGERARRHG